MIDIFNYNFFSIVYYDELELQNRYLELEIGLVKSKLRLVEPGALNTKTAGHSACPSDTTRNIGQKESKITSLPVTHSRLLVTPTCLQTPGSRWRH